MKLANQTGPGKAGLMAGKDASMSRAGSNV